MAEQKRDYYEGLGVDKNVSEDEIKRAIRDVYRGFLQPGALWHRLTSTRTLFDVSFYYRGIRSLIGHLVDFRSA